MIISNNYILTKLQLLKQLQQSKNTKFSIYEIFSNDDIKELEKILKKTNKHISVILVED